MEVEIKHSVLMKGFSTMSMPQEAEGTRPDMKVKLKSFLSGKWGAGSRRLSAQHFLTLKIDFNFPFTCNVWCGLVLGEALPPASRPDHWTTYMTFECETRKLERLPPGATAHQLTGTFHGRPHQLPWKVQIRSWCLNEKVVSCRGTFSCSYRRTFLISPGMNLSLCNY